MPVLDTIVVEVVVRGPQGPQVTDGDKGDIVVSDLGTNWQIDAGAVGDPEVATPATAADGIDGAKLRYDPIAAPNVITRTIKARLQEEGLTPEDFGAVADGSTTSLTGTDNAAAFNDLTDYLRSVLENDTFGNPSFIKGVVKLRPGGIYKVDSSLNFSGFRSEWVQVHGRGATIFATEINNQPIICADHSIGIKWRDLCIYAENGATSGSLVQPNYGLTVVQTTDFADVSQHLFDNVRITGWYNKSCFLMVKSELNTFIKPWFTNRVARGSSDFNGLALHISDVNDMSYVSPFQTQQSLTSVGMNENLFIQGNFNSNQSNGILIQGTTRHLQFKGCYQSIGTSGMSAVLLKGSHNHLELDIHVETAVCKANVTIDKTGNPTLYNCAIRDHNSDAIVGLDTQGTGAVNMYSCELDFARFQNASSKPVAAASDINFHGTFRTGSTVQNHNDLSGFNSFRGQIITPCTVSLINPNFPYATIISQAMPKPYDYGGRVMYGGGLDWHDAATVASASTCDIGAANSNNVIISGTTTITSLGTANNGVHRFVRFSGALTLTHNATSLILPGGANITTAADDTALFVSSGSGNWRCHYYSPAGALPVNRGGTGGTTASAARSSLGAVNIAGDTMTGALGVNLSGASPTSPAGTGIYLAGASGSATRVSIDAVGAVPQIVGRRANGTYASPTATVSGDALVNIQAWGHTGTAYTTAQRAGFLFVASENWTTTANGTLFRVVTTANGATSTSTRLEVGPDGAMTPGSDNAQTMGTSSLRWSQTYSNQFRPGAGAVIWTSGAGTPEGAVTAPVGSLYTRTDGGAATTLYVKESGTGNTGWVGK